jgi:hypothetical protein
MANPETTDAMRVYWSAGFDPDAWEKCSHSWVDHCAMPKTPAAFDRLVTRTARREGKRFRRRA